MVIVQEINNVKLQENMYARNYGRQIELEFALK